MSENLHPNHEHQPTGPEHGLEADRRPAEAATDSPNAERHEHRDRLAQIQKSIEKQALSAAETAAGETETAPAEPARITRELKRQAYRRSLRRTQKQMGPVEKTMSRLVHQPMVETLSEAGAKTLARPSGLLGGGIAAVGGSTLAFYMAKHYGFQYNFLLLLILFVGGFALGLVAELGMKLVKR